MEQALHFPDDGLSASGPIGAPSLHVLVCDDDQPIRDLAKPYLESVLLKRFPDVRISRAASREDALRIVRMEYPPDAIVLDLVFKGEGDLEDTIAALPIFIARTAVVILTGHARERVESLLVSYEVELVEKKTGWLDEMIRALVRAIMRRSKMKSETDFNLIDGLLAAAKERLHGPSTTK